MVFDYSKLRGRIVEKYDTQYKFAKAVGKSERTLTLKLNNQIPFTQDDITSFCDTLDIPYVDIPAYFFTLVVQ